MKWYTYFFLLTALGCRGEITVTEEEVGADVFYAKDSYKPYTGKCIVVYSQTSTVKEQFSFRNGKLHGESLAWYKNGQLRRRGFYKQGQISGKWEFWDETGNKTIEAHYKGDILDGSFVALYANGKLKEKGQFSENKRTGKWAYYSENGRLIRSGTE